MIVVPLIDLTFLNGLVAGDAGTSNRRHYPGPLSRLPRPKRIPPGTSASRRRRAYRAHLCALLKTNQRKIVMPKFVIERDIKGVGKLPRQELQAISQKSCSVLQSMGPSIQWV